LSSVLHTYGVHAVKSPEKFMPLSLMTSTMTQNPKNTEGISDTGFKTKKYFQKNKTSS